MGSGRAPGRVPERWRVILEGIRLRQEAATPGPWSVWGSESGQSLVKSDFPGYGDIAWVDDADDAAFIASAHEDIGDLLELLDALLGAEEGANADG